MNNYNLFIKHAFEGLQGREDAYGYVKIRIDQDSMLPLNAGIRLPEGKLVLELGPIKGTWLPDNFVKPKVRGLITRVDMKLIRGERYFIVQLILNEVDCMDVFINFAANICEYLDELNEPKRAVVEILNLIDRWKVFFSSTSSLLTESQQTGLFGELFLLDYLISNSINASSAVDAWTGSKKTPQDFMFPRVALEVKTTTSNTASTLSISNLRQLDSEGLENLLLIFFQFDVRVNNEFTLPFLVKKIGSEIKKVSPPKFFDFTAKLLEVGYEDTQKEYYLERGYFERKVTVFEVKDGFPRLTKDQVVDGLLDASYTVSVASCKPFIIDLGSVLDLTRIDG